MSPSSKRSVSCPRLSQTLCCNAYAVVLLITSTLEIPLFDQAPLSPRSEAISFPPKLSLPIMVQRNIIYRPKPVPSDTAPCMLGNTAACKLAILGLPSFYTQTLRQKYVFMRREIPMSHLLSRHFSKPLTGPVLEVVSLIFMDKEH